MRSTPWTVATIVFAGCLGQGTDPPDTPGTQPPWAQPVNETLYLKAAYRLATEAPTKADPDRVAATPTANGFVNEDIRAFASGGDAPQRNYSSARLTIFYEVVGPTVDPFVNQGNPQEPPRALVFWLGSRQVYPSSVSTLGDPVLVPGRTYRADAALALPPGGWIVPKDEPLQLLVATLAASANNYELRFLVDSTTTPSRLELVGNTSHLLLPPTLHGLGKDFTIPGNAGMFTGATADKVSSRVRTPVSIRANDTYVEVRVLFRGNQGGKSDLDFVLYAPDGVRSVLSTTPFQNETVRLFAPQLAILGAGDYTADVEAYSGVNTRFSLQVYYDSPR